MEEKQEKNHSEYRVITHISVCSKEESERWERLHEAVRNFMKDPGNISYEDHLILQAEEERTNKVRKITEKYKQLIKSGHPTKDTVSLYEEILQSEIRDETKRRLKECIECGLGIGLATTILIAVVLSVSYYNQGLQDWWLRGLGESVLGGAILSFISFIYWIRDLSLKIVFSIVTKKIISIFHYIVSSLKTLLNS